MLAAQAVAPDLRLVVGAGLSLLLEHRVSDDIDLFRVAGEDVAPVAVAVERAALLGRSELRDLVDLWFIERAGLPAIDGLLDATAKDGGVDPAWLAGAAKQVEIRPLAGLVAPLDRDELTAWSDRLAGAPLDAAGAKVE